MKNMSIGHKSEVKIKKLLILSLICNCYFLIFIFHKTSEFKIQKENGTWRIKFIFDKERLSVSKLNFHFGLLSPTRDKWQMPDKVIETMNLKQGDVIADIGAGFGYFSYKFAKQVGPEGKVYALDISDLQVNIMNSILNVYRNLRGDAREEERFDNIIVKKSYKDNINLNESLLDFAFMCDVYFYTKKHLDSDSKALIKSIYRSLKENGRVVVIDKYGKDHPQIDLETIQKNFEGLGFKLVDAYDFLPNQILVIFNKA